MPCSDRDKQWFTSTLKNKELVERILQLKMIVLDIDGTLTNGKMAYGQEGEDHRFFSIPDGLGIVFAQQAGLKVAFVSGKKHPSVQDRAKKLGIPEQLYFGGPEEKLGIITTMAQQQSLSIKETLLFGDDFVDAKVKAEEPNILFAAPQDAPFYFRHLAEIVIPRNGGHHAARLLLDFILYVHKKHFAQEHIDNALNNA